MSLKVGSRWHRLVVGVVVAALVVAGAVVWWASRPGAPTLLGEDTGSGSFYAAPAPLAEAAGVYGLAQPEFGTHDQLLTFHGQPVVHFKVNTAAAKAQVGICFRADGEAPIGAVHVTELKKLCSEVQYIKDGTRVRWVRGSDGSGLREYLILVLTPTRPGTARVDRVTYDYELESGESGTDVGRFNYSIRAT